MPKFINTAFLFDQVNVAILYYFNCKTLKLSYLRKFIV